MRTRGPAIPLCAVALACGDRPLDGTGEPWPEADALFHRDGRFAGADGAYTIPLGDDRVLWLFGDSFIRTDPEDPAPRVMVRNAIAVQTGRDPTTAVLEYVWRTDAEGQPRSFFLDPERDGTGARWFWPGSGIRLGDTLVVFGGILRGRGPAGPNNFEDERPVAYLIDNPDDPPLRWSPAEVALPAAGPARGVDLGDAAVYHGGYVYVFGNAPGSHAPVLVRYAPEDVAAGRLDAPEGWCGDGWGTRCALARLFAIGAPEFSVHLSPELGAWVYVATAGYGATTVVWRTAPSPEGPWSEERDLLRPPESFVREAFVYAGKAHAGLDGGGAVVATYVPSLFVDLDPDEWTRRRLYSPHFVRLWPR